MLVLAATVWAGARFARTTSHRPAIDGPDIERFAARIPQQLTTAQGFDGYVAFAPDGRSVAYASDRSGALEIYVQGVAPGSTPAALTSGGRHSVQPAWSPDGEYLAYHDMSDNGIWIVPSRGGAARKVAEFGSHPVWSPDGRRLAFQSLPASDPNGVDRPGALSTIWVVDGQGRSQPVRITSPGEPAGPHLAPVWLRDSQHLLFAATPAAIADKATGLWSVDVDSRALRQAAAEPRLSPEYALAPNGRSVYFVARGTSAVWWLPLNDKGLAAGESRPTGVPAIGSRIAQLAVSSDGRRLAWTALDSSNHVWATGIDDEAADAVPLTQGLGVWYRLPAPASDGRLALVGNRPGSPVSLYLLAPGAPLRQVNTDPQNHGGPQWLPGEREIAIVAEHGEGPGFWAIDPDTARERPLFQLAQLPRPPGASQASTAAPSVNIAFTRDFTRLAMAIVQDGRSNVWVAPIRHLHPDGALVQRTFEAEGGSYPTWSPDGRWIAYQCSRGTDTDVCVTGATGGKRLQLTHESGQSWVGGWADDNDTILFAARRGAVWNLASVSMSTSEVRMLTRFTEPRAYVRYPRWDAAHKRAVFERSETTGRLWSVDVPD